MTQMHRAYVRIPDGLNSSEKQKLKEAFENIEDVASVAASHKTAEPGQTEPYEEWVIYYPDTHDEIQKVCDENELTPRYLD